MSQRHEFHKSNDAIFRNISEGNLNPSENINDKVLWKNFMAGSEDAFISIYDTYFELLINYSYQFTFNVQQSEDLVQDLFIELRNKRHKLPPIKSSIKVYLMISVKNRFLNFLRKERFRSLQVDDIQEKSFKITESYEQEIIDRQTHQFKITKLKEKINGLPMKQREVIFYYFYEGMSYEEIKTLLDLQNIKSARNLVYKAIKSLRTHLLDIVLLISFTFF